MIKDFFKYLKWCKQNHHKICKAESLFHYLCIDEYPEYEDVIELDNKQPN